MRYFEQDVTVVGTASPAEFMLRLAEVTAAPRSLAKRERAKLLRGKLRTDGGVVRWPLNQYDFASPRSLHFTVQPSGEGAVLAGTLRLWLAYRIIVLGWLILGIAFNAEQTFARLYAGQGWTQIRFNLIFIPAGIAMALAYTWLIVRVGRRRERKLLFILGNLMKGDTEAAVIRELIALR